MSGDYYNDQRVAAAYDAEMHALYDQDVPFYAELAQEAAAGGHSTLELACGTGRVTIPIAQAGVNVVGLDKSVAMLDVARGKSAGLTSVCWVEGDMTDFDLSQRFGLIIIPARSFLLLLTVEAQKACLSRVHQHLIEGGRLALNIFNPDLVVMGRRLAQRRQPLRQSKDASSQETNLKHWEKTEYHTASQSLDWQQRDEELSDDGAVIARVERNLRARYVFRYEMEHLLALCGFEVEALYGWFDRRPFDDQSSEQVWLARAV